IDDFNAGDNTGSSYFQVNQKRGRRWSAARGFLKPVMKRTNLRVETAALVEKVEICNGKATAILFRKDGRLVRTTAKGEIVLSAGAVASPGILERSGIGDAERLKGHGIEPVLHA